MYVNLYSYETANLANNTPEWKRKDNNLNPQKNKRTGHLFNKRK